MKKLLVIILFLVVSLQLQSQDYFEPVLDKNTINILENANQQKINLIVITIRFDIGRPKFRCRRGLWICNRKKYPDEFFKPEYDPSTEGLFIFNLKTKQVILYLPDTKYLSKLYKEKGVFGSKDSMPIKIGNYIIKPGAYELHKTKISINGKRYGYVVFMNLL